MRPAPAALAAAITVALLVGCGSKTGQPSQSQPVEMDGATADLLRQANESARAQKEAEAEDQEQGEPVIVAQPSSESPRVSVTLVESDGDEERYALTVGAVSLDAVYTEDNWKVFDSYKLPDHDDILAACEALSQVHGIHSADMQGLRSAEDLAQEWETHNLAYENLPEDSQWKEHAKDVDLNPDDEGKTISDYYYDATGEELSLDGATISEILDKLR